MCLAIPAKIVALDDSGGATVELGNVKKDVQVTLLESPQIGDYVIVHAGFALSVLDPDEAQKTLDLFDQVAIDHADSRVLSGGGG